LKTALRRLRRRHDRVVDLDAASFDVGNPSDLRWIPTEPRILGRRVGDRVLQRLLGISIGLANEGTETAVRDWFSSPERRGIWKSCTSRSMTASIRPSMKSSISCSSEETVPILTMFLPRRCYLADNRLPLRQNPIALKRY